MVYAPAGWITTTDVIWYDLMFLAYYLSFFPGDHSFTYPMV